ncbi:protein kinase (plasmid) [Gemmatirosa kalamazoonensis]|uniref:non-specific serine/threonine protein kinase n=1 Tax=Gemmatirosa kalamazoonensis TaxID=861299 RepID=W0RTB9_9BACT|nr:serine/threonine-protein kinase [Gemmatirosa kalamazoonensis]AHG93570.1 protein kinase [Gemmatirosa kalamazoonensis]
MPTRLDLQRTLPLGHARPDTDSALDPRALGTRYRVERELGGAGASRVLLARDLAADRSVALKILGAGADAAERARFDREIALTARLRHPGVIEVLDAGRVGPGGSTYYVMPYVGAESLHERIARHGPLAVGDALRIAHALAGALAHAHAHGVVHRDVKPANVLLAGARPVLIDFGIACTLDGDVGGERITATGSLVGTPTYMSPEQAAGDGGVDGRADVYALGCVLYEMLTGEPPFSGRTDVVLCRRLRERPPHPRHRRRDIPADVDAAVVRALAPLPTARYDSAAAFAAALERALARDAGRAERGEPWHTRGWRVLRSLGLALTIGA